jgi:hypothetical protein
MKIIFKIIAFVWELPQTILAYFLYLFYKKDICANGIEKQNHLFYINNNVFSGISLGRFIFLNIRYLKDKKTTYHEKGHSIQSLILGPFYLLVIGIPSLIHSLFNHNEKTYYNFYTEKWADKLYKIERKDM